MQQVIIVTGPTAAGKSSVAIALCERFDRMVHIDVDQLRHMVRAGYRHPWAGDQQGEEQLELAIRNTSAMTRECVELRYAVVIDDIVTPRQARRYAELLTGIDANVHLVTLLPSLHANLERQLARDRQSTSTDRTRALHTDFSRWSAFGKQPGMVLDTSDDQNPAATADRVQDAVASGQALLVAAPPT